MGYDGNGNFTRNQDWTADRDAGQPDSTISATKMDDEDDNFKSGFDLALTRDGQAVATANLPMGGFAHTNVADATLVNQYGVVGQIQNSDYIDAGTSSGTDTITATLTPTLTAYEVGQVFSFVAGGTNTTAVTLNIDSVGALAIQKLGAALVAGDITSGDVVQVRHDGTQFQMLSPARTPVLTAAGIESASINTGTSGAVISLLDGNNTHSGTNTFSANVTLSALVATPDKGELTISSGAITITGANHTVDTESDASTDNLDTINGGTDGEVLYLRTEDSARDVVLTTAGNILPPNGLPLTLTSTGQPVKLIFDAALSKFLVFPSNAGKIIQVVNVQDGAVATGTTQIPYDDTIPQNTEGTEFMTLAIIPTSATSRLKIEVVFNFGQTGATTKTTSALFQDSTAGALAAAGDTNSTASSAHQVVFTHNMVAGTTSSTTFKVRAGPGNPETLTFNGAVGARIYGGVMASSITITEYLP